MTMIPRCSCGSPVVSFNQCRSCGEWGCPECEFSWKDPQWRDRCNDCVKETRARMEAQSSKD